MASFLSEDQFTCSICLDVFTNPVSTPCGHSYCLGCISCYWDSSGGKPYMCPICKEPFRKRPELHVNRTLKEITEQFKQMAEGMGVIGQGQGREHPPNTHPQHHHQLPLAAPRPGETPLAGPRPGEMPESVLAEMMTRFKRQTSSATPPPSFPRFSPSHTNTNASQGQCSDLPPPYVPPRRYTLSGPSDMGPDTPLCPVHRRGLDFFCRNDQACVCTSCLEAPEHHGHTAVPAKREWHIKKAQLGINEVELRELISTRERKVEEIKKSLQNIQACAERETQGSVQVFAKLVSCMEQCQSEVLEVIEMARRSAEQKAQSLVKDLEQEITELKKRLVAMSQLTQSEDYMLFLKAFPTLSSPLQTKDWSEACLSSDLTSSVILRGISQMMERFQEELQKVPKICQQLRSEQSIARPNPKVRRVQEYAVDVTLDPHTAHPRLLISVDCKQVCCGERYQMVPDNPERFDRVVCVLAREGFRTGRHYWEVEVGNKSDWDLGVASQSINRKGKITVSPAHGYWFLSLRDGTDYAFRTEPSTALGLNLRPSRIGIFVDCEKGTVSFYNVDAKLLMYTFTDSFSDMIHPFFSPCTNKSGRNEAPLIICPVAIPE